VAFSFPVIEKIPAAALNHLLVAEPWARERLAPFAGETIELSSPPFPAVRLTIAAGGLTQPASPEAVPSLRIVLMPHAAGALLRGEEHFMRAVEVSGNAKLAEAVMALVRHLRWDFEEDLSRVVGDVAARRLAGAARDFLAWQSDSAQRIAESLAEYVTEEKKLVIRRGELDSLAEAIARLRDGVERLEQRLRRLDPKVRLSG
jgi:ubiquinone biosynthesis protein UbiJ